LKEYEDEITIIEVSRLHGRKEGDKSKNNNIIAELQKCSLKSFKYLGILSWNCC